MRLHTDHIMITLEIGRFWASGFGVPAAGFGTRVWDVRFWVQGWDVGFKA